ncbi:MAG: hypothetical protein DMD96_04400 [Candidatus Rokuibacteriota bacterium]|nr:MAG: hypothetical protein DMD96_04400 [Candidatus Rokubacteria bacterium]
MTYIGDANDVTTIRNDAMEFFGLYFAASDEDEGKRIDAAFVESFAGRQAPPWWDDGRRASALVHVYDLIAPLDAELAAVYLRRLGRMASKYLENRDDVHGAPPDAFRGRVMPSWGAKSDSHDDKWNTDVVLTGLLAYPMAAFARRVADRPARYPALHDQAIGLITATIQTYEAYRDECHLVESDPHAYYLFPHAYADLKCTNGVSGCEGFRERADKPIPYNTNLSMMKALAELALAADSALYRSSGAATPDQLRMATEEAPLLIAKNVAFFVDHLRPKTLSDGTPYVEWDYQVVKEGIENLAHGGLDLGCLAVILEDQIRLDALLARAGRTERIRLSPALGARFANTFLRKVWKSNELSENVDGSGERSTDYNQGTTGWVWLAQFDPWVWTRCRDTTFVKPSLVHDNHAALLRYRKFNAMKHLSDFAGQNWLITPAPTAVGQTPPTNILDQKWLLVLSGVVIADLKGDSRAQWDHQVVTFSPDMAGPDDPSATSGPLNWAIGHYSIPRPAGSPGAQYLVRFSVESWAPFVSLSAIFNQGQSINSGFAVDAWRPEHFASGTNVVTGQPVNNLFNGVNVDLAVRDTDAWLYRIGYNITLLGKIVFVAPSF